MRTRFIASFAAAAALVLTASAFAQVAPQGVAPAGYTSAVAKYDAAVAGYCDAGCCDAGCCDSGCCGDGCCGGGCCDAGCCGGGYGGGWFVDFEANFMRFNQADGVGTAFGGTPFDHEFAPRITVGVVGGDGLGLRARYWEFDHESAVNPGGFFMSVDTYNLDIELFERIDLCCHTSVEWSAGLRFNEYEERIDNALTYFPSYPQQFDGWGGVFGLQVNRCVGNGNFYARARWAILQSDSEVIVTGVNSEAQMLSAVDLTKMQTEIGLGYEMNRCLNNGMTLVGRVGYEWQYWNSYGTYFQDAPHVADVGFDGLVLGVGLYR